MWTLGHHVPGGLILKSRSIGDARLFKTDSCFSNFLKQHAQHWPNILWTATSVLFCMCVINQSDSHTYWCQLRWCGWVLAQLHQSILVFGLIHWPLPPTLISHWTLLLFHIMRTLQLTRGSTTCSWETWEISMRSGTAPLMSMFNHLYNIWKNRLCSML